MAAEKVNIVSVPGTQNGVRVKSILAPNARQTFVPVVAPPGAKSQAAIYPGRIPAILAKNARETHVF